MPKDWDEGNKKIEGIFGQVGLGNQDPEKLSEFLDNYEKALNTAEQSGKKKGLKFEDAMKEAEMKKTSEDTQIVEEDESS